MAPTKRPSFASGLPIARDSMCTLPPTYGSWINLVERWFAEITYQRIRRGVFRSVQKMETAIRQYIEVHKQNPKPFVWTKRRTKSSPVSLGLPSERALSNHLNLHQEPLRQETSRPSVIDLHADNPKPLSAALRGHPYLLGIPNPVLLQAVRNRRWMTCATAET